MQPYGDIVHVKAAVGIDRFDYKQSNGLDDKGIDEIFPIFNSKVWKGDKNYPPIDNIDDMIKQWKLAVTDKDELHSDILF